jgi:hypothetical protein
MFKIKIFSIFIICLVGYISPTLADEEVVNFHNFDVNYPDFDMHTINIPIKINTFEILNDEFGDIISLEGFGQITNPGEPKLPVKIISIAIPKNSIPSKLYYKINKQQQIKGEYNIKPASIVILDNHEEDIEKLEHGYNKNRLEIYSSNDLYPTEIVSFERMSSYREFDLIDVKIQPFSYNPSSRKLIFNSDFEIKIDIFNNQNSNEFKKTFVSLRNNDLAEEIIYNYKQAESWYTINNNKGQYEFVIITLEDLVDAVEPLLEWEIEKGRTVKVVTKSWIDSEFFGIDISEKIRNFLREKYPGSEWGIEDVLIVGNYEDIPLRKVWQGPFNNEKPETDFYYAELSRPDNESWDSNLNQKYGDNTDDIDYYAEVNVGRIPWSDYNTVLHICEKSVNFEQNTDPSFKNNILLLAAKVDQQTDGAVYTEYIANSTINPCMDHWSKTRLYERDSIYPMDDILNHFNVVSTWSNNKYAFVAWHAHGSPEGSYVGNQAFIHINDCENLNDEYPAIISSASCSNSDTDYLNIGQAMLKQGAVGFLGANKAAYYCSGWDNPNDGSDQSFKYFFTSKITSGEYTQGEALQYAIREMYTRDLWNQLKYETFVHSSLWGNPDLSINSNGNNNPPLKPNTPEGPSNGNVNREYSYTCYTSDPDNDKIYYCWSWGDDIVEWFGPFDSGEYVTAAHSWESEGNYIVKVKSRDIYGSESDWSDPIPITMPRNRISNQLPRILLWFFEKFPLFESNF